MAKGISSTRGKPMDRRGFLRTSAGSLAGALALPAIVSSATLGLNARAAASDRITIGLIGMGKQMGSHLSTMLGRGDTQVLAVCDVESVRLEMAQARANDYYAGQSGSNGGKTVDAYKDFRELCARDDIDAVLIATPNHWHAIPVVEAVKNGKDIYLEKPQARTIRECQAIVNAVRRYGRVFQQGSQQRSDNKFRFACELVRNGRIGRVHTVHVSVGGPPVDCYLPEEPVPAGLDWDFWLGPAPYRPYNSDIAPGVDYDGWPNWRNYRDYAGGMMTDWGAHHFDIAQWGLGMDHTGPVEVAPPETSGTGLLTYKYDNGVIMHHQGGTDPRAGVEFVGTHGRVFVNRGYLRTDPEELINEFIGPDEIHLYESSGHHSDWLECIRTRSRPICDVEIGHRTASVCHIGNIAYLLKRTLKWDPVHEQFVNDDEANRHLGRALRDPWRLV